MINKILGKNIEPKFAPDRAGDVKHSQAGIEKAKDILGYKVRVSFEEGLERTVPSVK
jgi:nucleoside-diphosphate-sugar epimerase